MKKILLLCFIAATFSSCAITTYTHVYVGDFTKYINEGFIISPTSDGYTYTPIATVAVEMGEGYEGRSSIWANPSYDLMLLKLVENAKAIGGTGILNLKIKSTEHEQNKYVNARIASGFVVKDIKKIGDIKNDTDTCANKSTVNNLK